MREQMLWNL